MIMQNLEKFQEKAISPEQMDSIKGGGLWKREKKITDPITGETVMQTYTWFGLKGTEHFRDDD